MRMRPTATLLLALWPLVAAAEPSDLAAARAQLQEGYRLKQQGQCEQAIPHLEESIRLDRQPKGLLNLAECEEKLGKLASAQAHLVQARDVAGAASLQAFRDMAVQRLQALEKRMPKLAIKLAQNAPPHSGVTRDGTELGQVSLGMPLPIDPGRHTVVVRGGGFERTYDVTLAEGDAKELEVTPIGGRALAGAPAEPVKSDSIPPAPPTMASSAPTHDAVPSSSSSERTADRSLESPPSGSSRSSLRTTAFVVGGLGLVAAGVGTGVAFSARSSWRDAASRCPEHVCPNPDDEAQADSARTRGNIATGLVVGGAAAIATAGVLLLMVPRKEAATTLVTPMLGPSWGGVSCEGRF